jgi:cytochrome P450
MIDDFLYGIIAERRELPPGEDLLSLLMEARDEETGEAMSEKQLRDEVLITFFAGHETTALFPGPVSCWIVTHRWKCACKLNWRAFWVVAHQPWRMCPGWSIPAR